jgi:hypothetical protein
MLFSLDDCTIQRPQQTKVSNMSNCFLGGQDIHPRLLWNQKFLQGAATALIYLSIYVFYGSASPFGLLDVGITAGSKYRRFNALLFVT